MWRRGYRRVLQTRPRPRPITRSWGGQIFMSQWGVSKDAGPSAGKIIIIIIMFLFSLCRWTKRRPLFPSSGSPGLIRESRSRRRQVERREEEEALQSDTPNPNPTPPPPGEPAAEAERHKTVGPVRFLFLFSRSNTSFLSGSIKSTAVLLNSESESNPNPCLVFLTQLFCFPPSFRFIFSLYVKHLQSCSVQLVKNSKCFQTKEREMRSICICG